MKISRIIFAAILTLVFATACSHRPDKVMSKEDFAQLLADLHRAEVVAESNTRTYNDSLKRVLRQSVYARHGVTSEEVDSTMSWYGYNMERFLDVYDRVIELLEKDLERAQSKASGSTEQSTIENQLTFDGDSVDIWTQERYRRVAFGMPSNIITFFTPSDMNMVEGDGYTWRYKLVGNGTPFEVTLTAEYRDGGFEFVTKNVAVEGWHDITLPTDTARQVRSIFGVINGTPRKNSAAVYIDSISLTRSRRAPYLKELRSRVKKFKPKK